MIAVIQRVQRARVTVEGRTVGECGEGLYVLLGVAADDTEADAKALADKIIDLRIFTDENGKMNLSLKDIDGELLCVSNFTLLAAYKKGRRPDYMGAAASNKARELYEYFTGLCREGIRRVECGEFGAHMISEIVTDGPVTISMDSRILCSSKR